MMYVKNLNDIDIKKTILAGGKGASLGEMIKNGISVPPGFVIISTAFEKFLTERKISNQIKNILKSIDYNSNKKIEEASKKIIKLIMNTNIPLNIIEEIKEAFKNLKSDYVAVRSSAIAEDSSSDAWAGQLESFLNTSKENLLINIKKCWASLYNENALRYCFQKKLLNKKNSVAVVVQKMIQSETSGICFTVNPVNKNYSEMIIESGFGLGEAIVGGIITPDTYIVKKIETKNNKINFKIISKNISIQKNIIVRKKNGNIKKTLSKFKQDIQKLDNHNIIELAKLCLKIEEYYEKPQDIEWALEKNKLYILQSRPITTLNNNKSNDIFDYIKQQDWFFGIKADESLLFYSVKQEGIKKYVEKEHSIAFADTLFISIKNDYPIRILNSIGASSFHEISEQKIFDNPTIIEDFIKADNKLWDNILKSSNELISTINKKDIVKSIIIFKKIFDLYEKTRAKFIIIFSLGLKLTQNQEKLSNIDDILKNHDSWRNSVAIKEDKMGETTFYFIKFLINEYKLNFNPLELMKFLTVSDLYDIIDKRINEEKIKIIISSRKKYGYIYLNFNNIELNIIENHKKIIEIQKYFLELEKNKNTEKNKDEILSGQVTFNTNKKVKGQVIIIKDKRDLIKKGKLLDNKILVAIQTTPQYISYLNNVKAILTDEGGVTCHAAIISRELKKACIVGTKIATQILKDNDYIELDLIKGIVKKI